MDAITAWKTTDGNTCSVYYDEGGWDESPRTWDNLGRIIVPEGCKYVKNELTPEDEEGNDLLKWKTKDEEEQTLNELYEYVFPLYVLDHSAVAFSTGFINSPWGHWDCGQIGWIVVTREDAEKENVTTWERAHEIIKAELDILTKWANGEVYGYILTDPDGNELDSCWGYYSIEDIKSEYPEIEEVEA